MLKKLGSTLAGALFVLGAVFCFLMGIVGITHANGDKFSIVLGTIFILLGIGCVVSAVLWAIKTAPSTTRSTKSTVNPYVDMTPFLAEEGIPIVNYSGVLLKPAEVLVYAVPAQSFTEKEHVVSYAGRSAGVSVRVAKGLYLRQGASRGKPIRQDVRKFFPGDYVITTQRLLFLGAQKSFECPIEKVTAVRPIANNAFAIIAGNKNFPVVVSRDHIKYALGFSNTVANQIAVPDDQDMPEQ